MTKLTHVHQASSSSLFQVVRLEESDVSSCSPPAKYGDGWNETTELTLSKAACLMHGSSLRPGMTQLLIRTRDPSFCGYPLLLVMSVDNGCHVHAIPGSVNEALNRANLHAVGSGVVPNGTNATSLIRSGRRLDWDDSNAVQHMPKSKSQFSILGVTYPGERPHTLVINPSLSITPTFSFTPRMEFSFFKQSFLDYRMDIVLSGAIQMSLTVELGFEIGYSWSGEYPIVDKELGKLHWFWLGDIPIPYMVLLSLKASGSLGGTAAIKGQAGVHAGG